MASPNELALSRRSTAVIAIGILLLTAVCVSYFLFQNQTHDYLSGFRQFSRPYSFTVLDLPKPRTVDASNDSVVRLLPFPYHFALSVPSDACGSRIEDIFAERKYRDHDQLEFTGSFFAVSASISQPPLAFFSLASPLEPRSEPVSIEGKNFDSQYLMLKLYHRGWIDHLHSWSNEGDSAKSLVEPVEFTLDSSSDLKRELKVVPAFTELIRGFELRLVTSGKIESLRIKLTDESDTLREIVYGVPSSTVLSWQIQKLPARDESFFLALNALKGDRGFNLPSQTPLKSAILELKGAKGSKVKIISLRPFGLTRDDIKQEIRMLSRWNVLPILSTFHGGFTSWTTLLQPPLVDDYNDSRFAFGQRPEAPAYFSDLILDWGVIFHNNISWDKSFRFHRIDDLQETRKFEDNRRYYYSERYDDVSQYADASIPFLTKYSWHAENVGSLITRFLKNGSGNFGEALQIYTHLDYFNPESFRMIGGQERPFVPFFEHRKQTSYNLEAFRILSASVYNTGSNLPLYNRGWLTPISVLSRYSAVFPALRSQASVDRSTVHIKSWLDPVTGQSIPDLQFASQDLHGQTFYVENSQNARIWVDGRTEISSFKKNSADQTGRESVTIVDESRPTIILGRVSPEQRGRIVNQENIRATVSTTGLILECRAKPCNRWRWRPNRMTSMNQNFLSLKFLKSKPEILFRVTLHHSDGRKLTISESQLGPASWKMSKSTELNRSEVFDFADISTAQNVAPKGPIDEVEISLDQAQPGDSILLTQFRFLRAGGTRPTHNGEYVIGGLVTGAAQDEEVHLESLAHRFSARIHNGWYLLEGVPPGVYSVFRIVKDRAVYPVTGREIEVVNNDMEVDFP